MQVPLFSPRLALPKSTISTYRGRVGFQNMGNTCYLDAALQCFLHTPSLIKHVLDERFKKECAGASGCASALRELVQTFATNEDSYASVRPSDLRHEVGRLHPQFNDYDQQDSFEFLILLMDVLHNETNRVRSKKEYSTMKQDSSDYNELVLSSKVISIEREVAQVQSEPGR